jgi:hypothetical protein
MGMPNKEAATAFLNNWCDEVEMAKIPALMARSKIVKAHWLGIITSSKYALAMAFQLRKIKAHPRSLFWFFETMQNLPTRPQSPHRYKCLDLSNRENVPKSALHVLVR